MRTFLITSAAALGLAACASTTPTPPAVAATAAAASAPATPAPQCWNGDAGMFVPAGMQAEISGVKVTCEKTSDEKSAQWMGKKR